MLNKGFTIVKKVAKDFLGCLDKQIETFNTAIKLLNSTYQV